MRRSALFVWILTSVVLSVAGVVAQAQTTWYVPPNPGDPASAFRVAFADAGANAQPGDTIVIRDNVWTDVSIVDPLQVDDSLPPICLPASSIETASLDHEHALCVTASGTAQAPITIRGESRTGTVLADAVSLFLTGSFVVVKEMTFQGPNDYTILVNASNGAVSPQGDKIQDIDFTNRGLDPDPGPNAPSRQSVILVFRRAHDLEISGNLFDGYRTTAYMQKIYPALDADWVYDVRIHDNTFRNGVAGVVIGTAQGPQYNNANNGADGTEVTDVEITNNLFQNASGSDSTEILMVKSSGNLVRDNTFVDCDGKISNRIGRDNIYDSNLIVRQTEGFRIVHTGNQVVNNVLVDTPRGVELFWGNGDTYSEQNPYPNTKDTLIANNTFVNSSYSVIFTYAEPHGTVPPDATTVANNVLIGDATGSWIDDPGTNPTVVRNLFYATDSSSIPGITGGSPLFADPQFTPPVWQTGFLGSFASGSPVIDTGVSLDAWPGDWTETGANGVARPAGCGIDLGHVELDEACNGSVPAVTLYLNGAPAPAQVAVNSGTTLNLSVEEPPQSELGYPIFWLLFGSGNEISYVWDFDGASVPYPLSVFAQTVPVTFDVPPGDPFHTFNLVVTVYDKRGVPGTASITVVALVP